MIRLCKYRFNCYSIITSSFKLEGKRVNALDNSEQINKIEAIIDSLPAIDTGSGLFQHFANVTAFIDRFDYGLNRCLINRTVASTCWHDIGEFRCKLNGLLSKHVHDFAVSELQLNDNTGRRDDGVARLYGVTQMHRFFNAGFCHHHHVVDCIC